MIDLKRTAKELKKDGPKESYKPPEYSYGTQIRLENEELDKLGMKELPDVGYEGTIKAKVKVISARQSASEKSGEDRCVELQIVAMDLKINDSDDGDEGTSHDEKAKSKIAEKLKGM